MALTDLKIGMQTKASVDTISGTKVTVVGVGQVKPSEIVIRVHLFINLLCYDNLFCVLKVGISIAFSIMTQVRILRFVSFGIFNYLGCIVYVGYRF